ncbi:MAG: toxin-antitoxin system HicB family antitoxin [Chloroflexi bacterium]|nr:toxin-antitoxin system HicB family antitoxin [Chloroflexota bacterium]
MNKTFPVELEEELHKRLKIAAIEEGITLHDLIVKTLQEKAGLNGDKRNTQNKTGKQ